MNKIFFAFAILWMIFANNALIEVAAEKPCRRQCSSRIYSQIVCAQDKDGRNCRKLKECELRELNCRLRSRKQSMLMQTYMQRCRFITTIIGQNKCAPPLVMIRHRTRRHRHKPTTMMRDCKRLNCWKDNSKRACYHCPYKGDICQLLTACQAERANCQRHWNERLIRADDNKCEDLKPGHMGRCKKFN
ncbi:uncharacterized protein ACRADG_006678 isoform 2-T2 [Cochliomyia hominivorax]